MDSLKASGMQAVTNKYPHIWPYILNLNEGSAVPPAGFNWEHWRDDQFEQALTQLSEATDPGSIAAAFQRAHERMVDDPPWLYIVHDLNLRAMSKRVHGFVPVQSWFVDLTAVSLD